jgi:hypothetical protein
MGQCATTLSYALFRGESEDVPFRQLAAPRPIAPAPAPVPITSKYQPLGCGIIFAEHLSKLELMRTDSKLWPAGAPAPSLEAIQKAQTILLRFVFAHSMLMPNKIVATAEGGVALCFIDGNKYSDIECLNGGAILGVTTNRRDRPIVWEVDKSVAGIDNAATRIRKFIGTNSATSNAKWKTGR